MADGKNDFKTTLESLFRGMDGVVSSKTVVGDAIHINGTIILPLVDVSFGIGAGAFSAEKKEKGMGGIGGKMSPSAVIVIQDGNKACKYQESRYHHKDPGYGAGCGRPLHDKERGPHDRERCNGHS